VTKEIMSERMKKQIFLSTAVLLAALGLSACAPVIVGGFVGGAMSASDRRTSGTQVEDEGIEFRGASAMRENFGEKVHVNITSYNRQVLITGEVPSDKERAQVEQLVGKIQNVRAVINELGVGPASSLSDRSNDALITARVKAAMVDTEDVFANVYKVVTERNTVYLMGRVTQREGARATEVARGVSGVKRVVRVFEYLSEEELQAILPKKVPEAPVKRTPVTSGNGEPITTVQPIATPVK
jgi:osmotically-inducible protein OsmY